MSSGPSPTTDSTVHHAEPVRPRPSSSARRFENLRRSLAMLNPGATASLSREEAIRLITEVADLQARLERLRAGLRQLVEEPSRRPEE